jgi:hypothetical protein
MVNGALASTRKSPARAPQDYGPARVIGLRPVSRNTSEIFELALAAMSGLVRQIAFSGVRNYADAPDLISGQTKTARFCRAVFPSQNANGLLAIAETA